MPDSSFEPSDLEEIDSPYPLLAEVRAAGPVARLQSGFWAITGHAAAMEVFKDKAFASGPIAGRFLAALPEGAARVEMVHRINFLDPPDHPRVRGLVLKAFTPRRVQGLVPWMEAAAEALLDGIDPAAPFDLLSRFAHQLPSLVISELLGVPPADRDQLTQWSDAVAPLLGVNTTEAELASALGAAEAFHAYLANLMEARRKQPGDDLLSALLAAEEGGERLSRAELMSLAATLYSAGHRTTRDLFANGMATLLSEPDRYARVVRGAWTTESVVAEFLRYETPTLYVARIPTEAAKVAGVEIGAWEPVLIYLAAANRDPAAYADPDEFQPGRGGPAALSFAHGAHFCLGAALAASEAEVMLRAVARRWPNLALAPGGKLHWRLRGPFRGLDSLPVTA